MAKPIIRIYTQPACQPCRLTKKRFNDAGVEYEEYKAGDYLDLFDDLDVPKEAPLVMVIEPWKNDELILDFWTGFRNEKLKEYTK